MKIAILLLMLIMSSIASAQTVDDIWKPIHQFIGEWQGTGDGEPGKGEYIRSYARIFDGKYIEVRNKATYPPQPKNAKGEVHEDIGYVSYDKIRKTFVVRQFHKEGFVNQYKLDSISPDGRKLIFISESIENIPSGWRARETWELLEGNGMIETFELAGPGKEFKVYTRIELKRAAKK